MTEGWQHLVPDAVRLRSSTKPATLSCQCCGVRYERGKFVCCAPSKGMLSHNWFALSCWGEGGCGKCVRHCVCPDKAERIGAGPLRQLAARVASEFGIPVPVRQLLPLDFARPGRAREVGEEG